MFTIVALSAARRNRSAAWITRNVPVTLTVRIRLNNSGVVSVSPSDEKIPAALTTPSSPPIAAAACSTAALTEAGSATSTMNALPPMPAATVLAASADRSTTATDAPSLAHSTAVARPMPEAPPVIKILRPASRAIRLSSRWISRIVSVCRRHVHQKAVNAQLQISQVVASEQIARRQILGGLAGQFLATYAAAVGEHQDPIGLAAYVTLRSHAALNVTVDRFREQDLITDKSIKNALLATTTGTPKWYRYFAA